MTSQFPFTLSEVENLQPEIIRDALKIDEFLVRLSQGKNFHSNIYKDFLQSFILNHNTSCFIDHKILHKIDKMIQNKNINPFHLLYFPHLRNNHNQLILIFFYIKFLVKKDKKNISKFICISPENPYFYILLSECFSPYQKNKLDIGIKDKNLRRVGFLKDEFDSLFFEVCEKLWCAAMENTDYLVNEKYKYPFSNEEPFFTRNLNSEKKYDRSPFLLLSTPSSGTQSIIYFLSWATGSKFRQFNQFALFQSQRFFEQDLFTCIEQGFHIHSHFPVPNYGMELLIASGYKVVCIDRNLDGMINSGKRHQKRRKSLHPIVFDEKTNTYFKKFQKFLFENHEIIEFNFKFEDLEGDSKKFFTEMNEQMTSLSDKEMTNFFSDYEKRIREGRLNFRRHI